MHDNTTQDHPTRQPNQETAALLKILQLGTRQIEAGLVQPADRVIARLRDHRRGTTNPRMIPNAVESVKDENVACE